MNLKIKIFNMLSNEVSDLKLHEIIKFGLLSKNSRGIQFHDCIIWNKVSNLDLFVIFKLLGFSWMI